MIVDLKQRGAKIDVWGVGAKLSTGQPDAALDGIYKLGAIRRPGGEWQYRIKLSEESAKASVPGSLQVRRFHQPDGDSWRTRSTKLITAFPSPAKS
jgi:Nicotinic acid phosphoribosyltransferase